MTASGVTFLVGCHVTRRLEMCMFLIILLALLPSIILGSRSSNQVLGQVRYPCSHCRQNSFHVIVLARSWFTLYFIPLIPLGKSFSARCNLCGYREGISEAQVKVWFPEAQGVPAGSAKTAQQWVDEGNAHAQAQRYEQALSAYEQAILLNPNFPGNYYQKGVALIALSRYEEALVALDQAIRLAPQVPAAYHQKGIALDALGQAAEAQAAREQAQQLARR